MKSLAIFGSTGSIGTQTLAVLGRNPGHYRLDFIAAHSNWRLMEQQIRRFRPAAAALTDAEAAKALKEKTADLPIQIVVGSDALCRWVKEHPPDTVVAAMVGHAGLMPVLAAIEAGADIALANKEVLVMAGALVRQMCRRRQTNLLPLDSEHSAVFQCLQGHSSTDVNKIILTASGGPFRGYKTADMENVTPQQAVSHPNWNMGAKISVDSATLMNKALEVIEARWLFDLQPEQIDVVVHPQSIIHSLVEFTDGSVLAQMGLPSMETPIQYALSWPRRWPAPPKLFAPWASIPALTFEQPDRETFPCLDLAWEALARGGTSGTVISVANDVSVEAFLVGRLKFNQIHQVVARALDVVRPRPDNEIGHILATVQETKAAAESIINSLR